LTKMNYPVGWDGQPIPYWLYKLNGLGNEYKCEICGNTSYWGRRAFEKHFQVIIITGIIANSYLIVLGNMWQLTIRIIFERILQFLLYRNGAINTA
jgi:hypothetical protein